MLTFGLRVSAELLTRSGLQEYSCCNRPDSQFHEQRQCTCPKMEFAIPVPLTDFFS